MPAVLLGANDLIEESHTEEPQLKSDQPEEEKSTHKTAFLVLVGHNGEFVLEPNINAPVTVERLPNASEVKGALRTIMDDIRNQEIAMTTITLLKMDAQRAMEAQQNAQIMQQMGQMRR